MAIGLDKVLTISAAEYFNITRHFSGDYTPVGVHANGLSGDIEDKFLKNIPSNAEVVVGYRVAIAITGVQSIERMVFASGTALVPGK